MALIHELLLKICLCAVISLQFFSILMVVIPRHIDHFQLKNINKMKKKLLYSVYLTCKLNCLVSRGGGLLAINWISTYKHWMKISSEGLIASKLIPRTSDKIKVIYIFPDFNKNMITMMKYLI